MEKPKNLDNFEEIANFLDNALKKNDIKEINENIALIHSFEDLFLKTYYRKKKEGVYYTSEKISRFIVSEALTLFLNNKLEDYFTPTVKLKRIKDIYKLTTSFKKKIFEILLNTKVCDPTCGSGVFLLACVRLIYNIIKKLDTGVNNLEIKSQILKNVYGSDINDKGIQLCKLKLLAWFYEESNNDYSQAISILKENLKSKNSLFNSNWLKWLNFDIVVGNPPYGNILSKTDKKKLKEERIFYNDIYCAFLLKALDWSKGIIGFLVPKSFLLRQGYVGFRNKFLSTANLLKIFDIGPNLFKNATNEVQIILYEKKNSNNEKNLKVYDYPYKKIIAYENQKVDSLRICFNLKCPLCVKVKKIYTYTYNKKCPYCGSETINLNRIRIKPTYYLYKLIAKIEKTGDLNYLNVKNFPKMIRGEEDKGLKEVRKLVSNNTTGTCVFLNAKEDFKYYFIKKNKSFNIEKINAQVLKGDNYEYYKNPKLLIKHNNIVPEAIYTENNMCFTSSIYSLLHDDGDELKYLCAVLNSILIQFYCTYGINNQKGTTINLNQYMIRHLPIVKPNEEVKNYIASRVDLIINLLEKSRGKINDYIIKLMRTIDEKIFNLYSITETERKVIISRLKNQITHFKNIYH